MKLLRNSLAALFALLAAPIGLLALAVRPAWRVGWRERLGLVARSSGEAPIWIHAASAGEALAGAQLVEALRERGHELFLSATTTSGRERLARAFPQLEVSLAPLDHPWCVAAALTRVRPSLLVLIETELWPSLVAGAARESVPVVVASGRVSQRAHARYLRLRPFFAPTLRRLSAVGARTEQDASRFIQLGADPARVSVMGDLKLDNAVAQRPLSPEFAKVLGDLSLFVAGSTHSGEELAALGALASCEHAGLNLALVIAPRRPERAAAVRDLLLAAGRKVRLRSELGDVPLEVGEILLIDSIGELSGLYARAALAFVGGTLAPVGGHNLLEPVHQGCPVVFGPHVSSVPEAAALLLRSQAGDQVGNADELAAAVHSVFADLAKARARGLRGQHELAARCGSAGRYTELLEDLLRDARAIRAAGP